jgi:hypothetical protein
LVIPGEDLPQPTDTATISSERVNQLFHDLDDTERGNGIFKYDKYIPDSKMITVKRGRRPTPLSILIHATRHVTHPRPPNSLILPARISMWHNDTNGDCVTAEEAFAKACHRPEEIFITDEEVEEWATTHGPLPHPPGWYEGANLYEVMQAMQTGGFTQGGHMYRDGSISSVNFHDVDNLHSAISLGPVKVGVAADQLEAVFHANGDRSGWFATGFHQETNYDHCVSLCGYGTISWLAQRMNVPVPNGVNGTNPGYALFTWGSIGIIDYPSLLAMTDEAWLRTPTTLG